MAPIKLITVFAISSIAILASSFGITPVNALSADVRNLPRDVRGHDAVAKRKRSSSLQRRCRPRPPPASGTTTATTTATAPATTSPGAQPPPPPPPPPPSNSGGGKAGLAWPNGNDPALSYYKTWKVSYIYTWSPDIPQLARDLGLQPLPMLWGYNQIDRFQQLVHAGYANIVLGMNEPNEPGQSIMSPQQGIGLWQQYIQPLKNQGYSLISPATSSNPNGKIWMRDFFNGCYGCTFDGVAVHWYDVRSQDFIAYITDWHDTFGKPIWVTEFACQNFNGGAQCSQEEVNSFMYTVTQFMDNTPWVAAYFAFGVMHDMVGVNPANQLMGWDGRPTALGYQYIG